MPIEFRIPYPSLVDAISRTLANASVPSPVRDIEAEIMAESDLLGVPSHGIRMLPGLVQAIHQGRANPNPQLKLLRERPATCLLDGDNGPGRFVSSRAMENAMERALKYGVGVCLATRVTHWGRAHAYAYRTARAGMIGLCTTNAIPNMLAWGSHIPLLGNNPLAIGVPRLAADEPIVLDMAMSQAAVGKIATFRREGKRVPTSWGLDGSGQPTDDPGAILSSRRLLPFGDHKGAGLALMMELITGALAGAMLSQEIGQADASGIDANSSKLFIALDVEAFVEKERYAERVQEMLAFLTSAQPGLSVQFPGERGWQTRRENLDRGVPIHQDILAELRAIGVELIGQ